MKEKTYQGFTLIELLAVIVILAVIALIATPLIMNVINDAKKSAARDAGYSVIKAGELKAATEGIESVNPPFHYDEGSNLPMKGTKPTKFTLDIDKEMKTQLRAWINGYCVVKDYDTEEVTIDESKKTEKDCVTGGGSSNDGSPVIQDGMIPVTFDSNGKTVKADVNGDWYDYDQKKWANAVAVTNDSRDKYKNASAGTAITESDILAYYVWIPRYKYQLWNVDGDASEPQEIKIEFESKSTPKSRGTKNGEWLTHPAFTFGSTELSGMWVGKFEMTGTSSSPTIKPNLTSLRNQNISSFFNIIQSMGSNYGLNSYDSHMMKNSEWGAVAYLSHSKYGKNGEVILNNNSNFTTGCGADSASESSTSTCKNAYGSKGNGTYNQSTTGNITGIFDMSGGAYEYVMANSKKQDGSFNTATSGFTSAPDSKYYDQYDYNTSNSNHSISKLGDAMKEVYVSSYEHWYDDYGYMPLSSYPWVYRGGHCIVNSNAGVFSSFHYSGSGDSVVSARGVVVSN